MTTSFLGSQCSHDVFQLVSWALKHAWYGLKEGAASPHLQTPCSHDGCTLCTASKNSEGVGGGAAPPHLQTQCSHDVFQLVSWALKHAWYGLKEGAASPHLQTPCSHDGCTLCTATKNSEGVGGGAQPPPHLQTQCSHDVFQLVSWALKHAWYGLKEGAASPHLQTPCSHDGCTLCTASKNSEGLGGSQPPPICKHNAHTMFFQLVSWALKHAWYGLKEAGGVGGAAPPICKHPAHMISWALKHALHGLKKSRGVGGAQPPHLQTQCPHDVFSTIVSGALKHAWHSLTEARGVGGGQPPPTLQTPCSHDGCQQVSWALKHALHA